MLLFMSLDGSGWVWPLRELGELGEKDFQREPSHFDSSLAGGCRQAGVDLFSKGKGQSKRKLPGEV